MTLPSRRFALLALLVATAASAVSADEQAFAIAFPISPPAGEPMFAIELPAEAYATLTTNDLADLVVVDAQGREQPAALLRAARPERPRVTDAFELPLPVPLPGGATSTPGRLSLHVRRDADGRLDALDLQTVDGMAAEATPAEWLIDAGDAARQGMDGLRLTTSSADDFRTRVDIHGSDDLVHWQRIGSALPVLRASATGQRIERLDVRFAPTTHRYLSVRSLPGEAALPALASLQGLREAEAGPPPLASTLLAPDRVSADGLIIDYARPGPLPVQQVEVQWTDGDGVFAFRIEEQRDGRWQPIASGTAWRLTIGGETLSAAPLPLWMNGTGPLRLVLTQPAPSPRLVLRYAPDRLVVMANGAPPFRLLAGSVGQRRTPVTLTETLDVLRQQQGEAWEPPLATLGPASVLAGATALSPSPDPGRVGLWAVLILGALAVGGLAWRLLVGGEAPPAH